MDKLTNKFCFMVIQKILILCVQKASNNSLCVCRNDPEKLTVWVCVCVCVCITDPEKLTVWVAKIAFCRSQFALQILSQVANYVVPPPPASSPPSPEYFWDPDQISLAGKGIPHFLYP